MQKQKNIKLILSLGIIITIIGLLDFFKNSDNGLSVNKRKFTLDQQTVITDVNLTSITQKNILSYDNKTWVVNNKYEVDPNMRDVFFSVLSQLEIRKKVSNSRNDSIADIIKKQGVQVVISNNQYVVKEYYIWGDSELQKSFLMNEQGKCFVVHIPGYRSYVAGIFEVPENDWRSRRVFTALFTNLNSLEINYPEEEIEFNYKNNFFEISGMRADSAQLITSLENLLFYKLISIWSLSNTLIIN